MRKIEERGDILIAGADPCPFVSLTKGASGKFLKACTETPRWEDASEEDDEYSITEDWC